MKEARRDELMELQQEIAFEKAQEMISTSDTRRSIAQDIADNIELFAQLLEPLNAIKENKVRVKKVLNTLKLCLALKNL